MYFFDVFVERVHCILDGIYAFGDIFTSEMLTFSSLSHRTRLLFVVFAFVPLLQGRPGSIVFDW